MPEQCRNSVGTPQVPMNTMFSYMFLYVPVYYIKEYTVIIE